jgi:ribonuclease HI
MVAHLGLGVFFGGYQTCTRHASHQSAMEKSGSKDSGQRCSHAELERALPMKLVTIYTDGACKGNPGPGGWGAFLRYGETERDLFGGEILTTNNRMELMAVIQALKALKHPCHVHLYLDSEYVRKGITEWLPSWKARGWRTAAKQAVKNADLWQVLDEVVSQNGHHIEWRWVKGHSGDPGNERADALANQGVLTVQSG